MNLSAKEVALKDVEIGQTYEVCDPVIGRIDPSFVTIKEDQGKKFLVDNLATGQEHTILKTCIFYELEDGSHYFAKDFDLSRALSGEDVITKDGRIVVSIKEINPDAPFSAQEGAHLGGKYIQGLEAMIREPDGSSSRKLFYHDGGSNKLGEESDDDLKMA